MKNRIFVLSVSLFCILLATNVSAKKADDPGIASQELVEIKTAVDNHGTSLATMTNQLNELVAKFQEMSGETGRNNKKIRDQDKVISDAETRLQVLEDKISILTGQLQELITEGLVSKPVTKLFDEFKEYAKGLEYINSKDYEKAIKEFSKFKEANQKSIFNSYAQYWIGESYYMQSDFPMAIKQYQKLLAANAKSAKAPTALYRQGLSFYNLNSFDDAKAFFSKVIRTYPESIEAIQASAQIKRIDTIQELKKQQELEMKMVQ